MVHLSPHQPVMLQEAVEALNIVPDGIYIDGTFGRGGHSQAILEKLGEQGRLICLDKDPEAIAVAKERYGKDSRVEIYHYCFSRISYLLRKLSLEKSINGILLDLGVSSPQLDNEARGFSFMREGPLDMRMDTTQGLSAMEWLQKAEASDIARVLKVYGEEPFAKRIARKIESHRLTEPLNTTKQLAELVAGCVGFRKVGHHPATKTFQAIRIYINQELEAVETVLKSGMQALALEGRFAIISFHSLEDRMVKRFFRQHSEVHLPRGIAIPQSQLIAPLNWVVKRQNPSQVEIDNNPRARSATLRVAMRNS